MLRIALPNKGRLSEDTRELFNDAGLEVRSSGERALTASLGGEFEAIFVRAQDIPEFVADGAADVGVTGWDLVNESGRDLSSHLDLGFGKCRLVVAAREESGIRSIEDIGRTGTRMRVATVFPNITRRFFEERGCPVDVVPVSGAAEIAPHLGIADIVVDLTSTGSTLRVNGLREVDIVLRSSAHLITAKGGPRQGDPERKQELDDLVTALASVIRARGQRYLMANVPRTSLDQVRTVLPGLNGPTVIEIAESSQFVAVHAVVSASTIYRTISQLRALGGEGILVTRIERLVP
ncbi:ATP phosphoribosyltransferase [Gemmatimonas phototrophica]|uniref:ATP phosphoribosyltransferase n=1 Tax=Gemmatimonas phototrophica TaxID=1379270 RepID=A0A143BFN7_9BACT|nr:ATP phosphoribosyltransferase [Gemmatimonas phototrophica]AMW03817.1 ATP phosphoribosyltransferase [Gemmatimonas phototrophica]